ncbi:MAG: helix-turn-helix domain-containing protein [Rhodospirillales bacterium]|nr:helix-turn-helix domain-containing protein [Rhodospirillales bacterium]
MITGRQIHAARALLGWSQTDLADRARISQNTVYRLENDLLDARSSTVESVWRALEQAGIEFHSDRNFEGVRLRKPKSPARELGATAPPKKR